MKDRKWDGVTLLAVCVLFVVLLTFGITKGIYHDKIEDACETDGWYETKNYRLVCQDMSE